MATRHKEAMQAVKLHKIISNHDTSLQKFTFALEKCSMVASFMRSYTNQTTMRALKSLERREDALCRPSILLHLPNLTLLFSLHLIIILFPLPPPCSADACRDQEAAWHHLSEPPGATCKESLVHGIPSHPFAAPHYPSSLLSLVPAQPIFSTSITKVIPRVMLLFSLI